MGGDPHADALQTSAVHARSVARRRAAMLRAGTAGQDSRRVVDRLPRAFARRPLARAAGPSRHDVLHPIPALSPRGLGLERRARSACTARSCASSSASCRRWDDHSSPAGCTRRADLESVLGITEGNIFHGDLRPDQLFFMRPVPEHARYATPLRALYLCGAGTHPGGGVTGAPGFNAAHRILDDLRHDRSLRRGIRA